VTIDMWVENISGAFLSALASSNPKCRPHDDTRPPITAGIQVEISLK